MINSLREKRYPYWNYVDLLLLAGLVLPCLIVATVVAQILCSNAALEKAKASILMIIFYALWFACLYLVLKARYYDEPVGEALGWIYPKRGLALAMLGGPLVAITINLVGVLLKTPSVDLPIYKYLHGQFAIAMFGVVAVIFGPATEELAFRGFMLPLLNRTFGREVGILLAAVPFALLHGPQYGWTWQYLLLVGLAGVLFGVVRQWTGSTMASAGMHATYNLVFFVTTVLNLPPQ